MKFMHLFDFALCVQARDKQLLRLSREETLSACKIVSHTACKIVSRYATPSRHRKIVPHV